jgi:hypothetical protein
MFISIIGSGSAPLAPDEPTFIPMVFPFKSWETSVTAVETAITLAGCVLVDQPLSGGSVMKPTF